MMKWIPWCVMGLIGGVASGAWFWSLPGFQDFFQSAQAASPMALGYCLLMATTPWLIGRLSRLGAVVALCIKAWFAGLVFACLFRFQYVLSTGHWMGYLLVKQGLFWAIVWFWMEGTQVNRWKRNGISLLGFLLLGCLDFFVQKGG